MDTLLLIATVVARILLCAACTVALFLPAWRAVGRLHPQSAPLTRAVLAGCLALVGYLSFVNLVGRAFESSLVPATLYLVANALLAWYGWRSDREGTSLRPLRLDWRAWAGTLACALLFALPQAWLAASTPFWDEVASSAIHVTGANQFAESVFPPRHNAFPDVWIKYHYAFLLLSGTGVWLAGLSANVAIDVAGTSLWLLAWLLAHQWAREAGLPRSAALVSAVAVTSGGGLAWAYLPRIEAYSGFDKVPVASGLVHRHDPDASWLENLLGAASTPNVHLRNDDGSVSSLPWEIAAQLQQHAVAVGLTLSIFALYAFVRWQQARERRGAWFLVAVATFGLLFLAHAVFGGVAAVAAGLVLLGRWLRHRTWRTFLDGAAFTVSVAVVGFAHGGLLSTGAEYGASSDVFRLRDAFGYFDGGFAGFVHWNLAAFGVPLLLALLAFAYARKLRNDVTPRGSPLALLATSTVFAYLLPQFAYYASAGSTVEQFTEISKFFFPAHLGLALLAGYGVAALPRASRAAVAAVSIAAMLVMPLAFAVANSTDRGEDGVRRWKGFYRAPYYRDSIEEQLGRTLARDKHSPRDVYFDASADERTHGYLGELLIYGGSVFTLTPSRYERTGIGYRLSEAIVAERFVQNSRMARLLPGAAEACDCSWYYARPAIDSHVPPLLVRSRLQAWLADGVLVPHRSVGQRTLYAIARATLDADASLHRSWRPQVVLQAQSDYDGDGADDLIVHDRLNRRVVIARVPRGASSGATLTPLVIETIDDPDATHAEAAQLTVGHFPGEPRADLLFGRLADTVFRLGQRIQDVVEYSPWRWSYRDSHSRVWQPEYALWDWNTDVPLTADLDADGFDEQVAYRRSTGEWLTARGAVLSGPSLPGALIPVPFAGRFRHTDRADLGVWSLGSGRTQLQPREGGAPIEFVWGGNPEQVLVPADYDGDGLDEIALWDRRNLTWYWRSVPDGAVTEVTFGTPTSVPMPHDYDGDGRVDLAYWEPGENLIHVSLDRGTRIAFRIVLPAGGIPAFVNLY